MSGRDETFVPPERQGAAPQPPPMRVPPRFGRSTVATGEPPVAFQAADAPADDPVSAAAPDAEESMIAPPPRRGSSVPDAEKTTPSPAQDAPEADLGATASRTAPWTPPDAPQTGPGGTAAASAERTVADVLEPEDAGENAVERTREESRSLAVARVAGGPPPAAETTIPPLIPDAILPPGFTPDGPEEPDAEPEMDATRPTPTIGSGDAGGAFPGDPDARPFGRSPGTGRRALLVGGGALAALLLGGGGVIAYTTAAHDTNRHPVVRHTQAAPPPARPSPTPTPAAHRPKTKLVRVDIRDEKKDPVPLTPAEVFPTGTMKVAGHTFAVVKTVLNNHCDLTANGSFSTTLTQQHCRSVVRATLVSDDKKIAVTAGIAAMPTDAAAVAVMKAQDPARYNWFRGLKVDGAPKIDGPGGFAASARRGRYICYAYVMYADGHKPKKGDKTLQQLGDGFRAAMLRPINHRAKSKVAIPQH